MENQRTHNTQCHVLWQVGGCYETAVPNHNAAAPYLPASPSSWFANAWFQTLTFYALQACAWDESCKHWLPWVLRVEKESLDSWKHGTEWCVPLWLQIIIWRAQHDFGIAAAHENEVVEKSTTLHLANRNLVWRKKVMYIVYANRFPSNKQHFQQTPYKRHWAAQGGYMNVLCTVNVCALCMHMTGWHDLACDLQYASSTLAACMPITLGIIRGNAIWTDEHLRVSTAFS